MTREEAIKIIRKYECNKEHYEACEMAIEALEQEPCEDCISRQAVLNIDFNRIIHATTLPSENIKRAINDLPPVSVAEKVGKWVRGFGNTSCTCSECGGNGVSVYKVCPWCGARMVEPQESEDRE